MTTRPRPMQDLALPAAGRGRLAGLPAGARWGAAAAVAGILVGLLAASLPIILMGIAGLAVATWSFLALPWLVLSGALLLRATIDDSGSLISIGPFNIVGLMAAGVAFGGLTALWISGRHFPQRKITYPWLALIVLALYSLTYSRLPDRALGIWLSLVAMLSLFCWSVVLVRTERDMRRVVWLTLAGSVIPILVALYQWVTGTGASKREEGADYSVVQGTLSFANGFAFLMFIVFALAVVMFMDPRASVWRKGILALGAGGALVSLFLTYTRSAWIALPLVLLIMGFLHFRKLLAGFAIVGALCVLAAPAAVGAISDRFSDLSSSVESDTSSWAWRVRNWSGMVMYADDHPWKGYGLGSYQALTFERFGVERNFQNITDPEDGIYAHNDYLNMAVELGWTGLAFWTLVLLGMLLVSLRALRVPAARPYAAAMVGIWVALIMISATDNVQQYSAMLYYPIALTGGLAGMTAVHRAEQAARRRRQPTGTGRDSTEVVPP